MAYQCSPSGGLDTTAHQELLDTLSDNAPGMDILESKPVGIYSGDILRKYHTFISRQKYITRYWTRDSGENYLKPHQRHVYTMNTRMRWAQMAKDARILCRNSHT